MSDVTTQRNPSAAYTRRRSRKDRICEHCRMGIEAGESYYRASLPPHTDVNSGASWWTMILCLTCGAPNDEPQPEDLT